ncbi:unnamed protein product [Linum tenue]|uniref:Uncharacterized protein n=1 Tax=Linum tenue TaxID=586396 RepID=A0AAV0JMT5_9ROSI|nr:unnamed protein product [Linum tenue]
MTGAAAGRSSSTRSLSCSASPTRTWSPCWASALKKGTAPPPGVREQEPVRPDAHRRRPIRRRDPELVKPGQHRAGHRPGPGLPPLPSRPAHHPPRRQVLQRPPHRQRPRQARRLRPLQARLRHAAARPPPPPQHPDQGLRRLRGRQLPQHGPRLPQERRLQLRRPPPRAHHRPQGRPGLLHAPRVDRRRPRRPQRRRRRGGAPEAARPEPERERGLGAGSGHGPRGEPGAAGELRGQARDVPRGRHDS